MQRIGLNTLITRYGNDLQQVRNHIRADRQLILVEVETLRDNISRTTNSFAGVTERARKYELERQLGGWADRLLSLTSRLSSLNNSLNNINRRIRQQENVQPVQQNQIVDDDYGGVNDAMGDDDYVPQDNRDEYQRLLDDINDDVDFGYRVAFDNVDEEIAALVFNANDLEAMNINNEPPMNMININRQYQERLRDVLGNIAENNNQWIALNGDAVSNVLRNFLQVNPNNVNIHAFAEILQNMGINNQTIFNNDMLLNIGREYRSRSRRYYVPAGEDNYGMQVGAFLAGNLVPHENVPIIFQNFNVTMTNLNAIDKAPSSLITYFVARSVNRHLYNMTQEIQRLNFDNNNINRIRISLNIRGIPFLRDNNIPFNLNIQTNNYTLPNIREMFRQVYNEIDNTIGSSVRIDIQQLRENPILDFTLQLIHDPTPGWLPRFHIEDYYRDGILQGMPPSLYEKDKNNCIILSIICASVRQFDEDGICQELPYVIRTIDTLPEPVKIHNINIEYGHVECAVLRLIMQDACNHLGVEDTSEINWSHMNKLARYYNVRIHVIRRRPYFYRFAVYGEVTCHNHITLMYDLNHLYSVHHPWELIINKDNKQFKTRKYTWCDYCHNHHARGKSINDCKSKPIRTLEDEEESNKNWETLGGEYVKWKFERIHNYKENRIQTSSYCHTCNEFHIKRDDIDKRGYFKEGHDSIITSRLTRCMNNNHNVDDEVEISKCLTCGELLPCNFKHEDQYYFEHRKYWNEHKCYMDSPAEPKIGKEELYWVWDIESYVNDDGKHICNYIYACKVYNPSICLEAFSISEFCEKIFNDIYKDTIWIAHNSGGYDVNFIHQVCESKGIRYDKVPAPTSINRSMQTTITDFNISFIDSYMFIPLPLSKIGPAFNLPVHKGDFPHNFSKLENQDYHGCMPPCDTDDNWYGINGIRGSSIEKAESNLTKFLQWHDEEKQKYIPYTDIEWKYMDELKKYCRLDCLVLSKAMQSLRNGFLSVDNEIISSGQHAFKLVAIDPLQYLTMAQVCQNLYLMGMKAGRSTLRIAHIPLPFRLQLPERMKFLEDMEKKWNVKLHKASTHGQEYIMDDLKIIDGFVHWGKNHPTKPYSNKKGLVVEYLPCIENSCRWCTNPEKRNESRGVANNKVYKKIRERLDKLKTIYEVEEMWECQFKIRLPTYMMEIDTEHDYNISRKHFSMSYLRQKDEGGFYGGRTEVFKPLYECEENEKIQYVDVVSLYPWVCATNKLPTGHPIIYRNNDIIKDRLNINHPNKYFGYVHVELQGNPDDYFGCVPRRSDNTGRLIHDNASFDVVCFTEELYERMNHGAIVTDIYEVWHYDDNNSCIGPMRGYVSQFLRDKMECSGWKALCGYEPETDEEKHAICDKLEIENLGLCKPRFDKVFDNPGGRQLAKLRLNMLWGKFVQQPVKETCQFILSYGEYVKLWAKPYVKKDTMIFRPISGASNMFEVKYKNSYVESGTKTNYYLGAGVTAQARIKLIGMLRQVGPSRACYCDTDSVVYVQRDNENIVETSEALGGWSSEMTEGVWGKSFIGLAPKCYFIEYNDNGKQIEKESGIIKTKGITLTIDNLKTVNYSVAKDVLLTNILATCPHSIMTLGEDGEPDFDQGIPFHHTNIRQVEVDTFNIKMDLKNDGDRSMKSYYGKKILQPVITKRKIHVPQKYIGIEDTNSIKLIDSLPYNNNDYNV